MRGKIIVFDIDGTIADISHRIHHVQEKPKNWKAFNEASYLDAPIESITSLFKFLAPQNKMILCTGRSEDQKLATEKWFINQGLFYDDLYMRQSKDHRQDSIVKVELLQRIRNEHGEPYLWFEDRSRVVEAIRAEGIKVLQVDSGNF